MRDLPVFTTTNGVGSLTLSEIPYKKIAYIKIQSSESPLSFLKECRDFCIAVGAERIFASGHAILEEYPVHCRIYRFACDKTKIGPSVLKLQPVTENTAALWRDVYNTRMMDVPNSVTLTTKQVEKMVQDNCCYLVYDRETFVGIGKVSGNKIDAIASCVPGYGEAIMCALAGIVDDEIVVLEAALENQRAIALYRKMGFVQLELLSEWYYVNK